MAGAFYKRSPDPLSLSYLHKTWNKLLTLLLKYINDYYSMGLTCTDVDVKWAAGWPPLVLK